MSDDERRIKELASDIVNHAFLQPKGDFKASLNAVEELLRLSWRKPRPVIPQGRGDVKTIVGFDRASPDGDFTGLTLLFSDGSIKHYYEERPEASVETGKSEGWSHAINFCLQQAHLIELADEANGGPVKSHPKTEMWKDMAEMLTKAAALGGAPAESKKNIPELYARREVGAGDGGTYVAAFLEAQAACDELVYAVGEEDDFSAAHKAQAVKFRECAQALRVAHNAREGAIMEAIKMAEEALEDNNTHNLPDMLRELIYSAGIADEVQSILGIVK